MDAPVPSVVRRHELWVDSLNGDAPAGFDPAAATIAFRLTPEQIDRAARAARHAATAENRPMTITDVAGGARAQNAAGLERLARRIEPTVGWDDLVLPSVVEAQLRELTARARHRDRVIGEWHMGTKGARGVGVTALFAGDSGTGKTMSAEVVGHDLALDVYVIDLSTVVDKYIGETEKNLDRIFTEADRVNGDPAVRRGRRAVRQAVRGQGRPRPVRQRRGRLPAPAHGAVRRARHPDDEPALERRRGLRPPPGRDHRLPDARGGAPPPAVGGEPARRDLPVADDIDLDFLARRFKISGGNIRNVCVTAAYLAAAEDRPVAMPDLVRATEREYRKLGRLTVEAEFGEYFGLLEA